MPKFMESAGPNARILGARELFERARKGNLRARAELSEALTTDDFPYLLGLGYDRELVANYNAITPVWQSFATRKTTSNFKSQTLIELLGGRAGLDKVKQGSEYKERSVSESKKTWSVDKYGAVIPLTWEMFINDDLGAFDDLPNRLATAARETEDRNVAALFFNAAGSALSTWADGQDVSSATLSTTALQTGIDNISQRKDTDGRPVITPSLVLMVPPALSQTANNIINTTEVLSGSSSTTPGDTRRIAGNGLSITPKVVVNPWLAVAGAGYSNISNMWVLLPDPQAAHPHIISGFLSGHETPDLRVKNDAGARPGGGPVAPEEGSFDDDSIRYRVRHVHGAAVGYDDALYIGHA